MSELSKKTETKSQLVCVTGFQGTGKTTLCQFLQKKGYPVFITDHFVHHIYQAGQIGYQLVANLFGPDYVDEKQVIRHKLRALILSDHKQKQLLEQHTNQLIYEKIQSLQNQDQLLFVELGIYIFFPAYFANLFSKVILVQSNRSNLPKNYFATFFANQRFELKQKVSHNPTDLNQVIVVDYFLANDGSIADLENQASKMLTVWGISNAKIPEK